MGVGTSWSLRFSGCILRLLEARVLRGDGVGDGEEGGSMLDWGEARGAVVGVVRGSPRSPLSGCLYRDVTWGTKSLYPIQIQFNIAELCGGLAP